MSAAEVALIHETIIKSSRGPDTARYHYNSSRTLKNFTKRDYFNVVHTINFQYFEKLVVRTEENEFVDSIWMDNNGKPVKSKINYTDPRLNTEYYFTYNAQGKVERYIVTTPHTNYHDTITYTWIEGDMAFAVSSFDGERIWYYNRDKPFKAGDANHLWLVERFGSIIPGWVNNHQLSGYSHYNSLVSFYYLYNSKGEIEKMTIVQGNSDSITFSYRY